MEETRYYRTTTDNPKILRFVDGVMQVFDIDKKWVNSLEWFFRIFFDGFTDFEEITENEAFAYIGRMVVARDIRAR